MAFADGYVDSNVSSTGGVAYTTPNYSLSSKYEGSFSPINPEGNITTTYYIMRGKDPDCGPVTYRTWTVSGSPDMDGSEYSGPKCGANPLTDIVVTFKYTSN